MKENQINEQTHDIYYFVDISVDHSMSCVQSQRDGLFPNRVLFALELLYGN